MKSQPPPSPGSANYTYLVGSEELAAADRPCARWLEKMAMQHAPRARQHAPLAERLEAGFQALGSRLKEVWEAGDTESRRKLLRKFDLAKEDLFGALQANATDHSSVAFWVLLVKEFGTTLTAHNREGTCSGTYNTSYETLTLPLFGVYG